MLAHALLEAFTRFRGREKALVGTRGRCERHLSRFFVALVAVDQRTIGNMRFPRPTRISPVLQKYTVPRRRGAAWVDQKIAGVDAIDRAKFERPRIA